MEINPVAPVVRSAQTTRSDEHDQQRRPAPATSIPLPPTDASRFEAVTEDGNEIVYRTVDPETGALLAQVPSEEVLRVAKRLQEMIAEGTIR